MKRITIMIAALLITTASFAQSKKEATVDQYGVEVKTNPVNVSERDGILVFESENKDYKLWFDTRIQADFGHYFGEPDYANEIGSGASIRRARFAVKANITPDWYGEIDMDFANGSFELKDALIRYTGVKNFEFTVGNFKPFYSISRNTTSRYLQFIERPMVVSALAPSRHLGVNVKYSQKLIWLAGGVFFQEIEGQETRTYVEDQNKDFGMDEGLSYVGKIVLRPVNELDYGIHIGAAGIYRNPKTSDEGGINGVTRFSARNTTNINRKKYVDTDDIKYTDHNLMATVELAGHCQGIRVESAWLADWCYLDTEKVPDFDKPYYFNGWYAQAGYLLLGGKQSYDSNGAKFNRIRPGKSWGDIELVARYEYIDLNDFEGKIYGGSSEILAAGLNFFIGNNVKFMVNYQYVNNDRYANGKNKLFVGYDAAGNPTKDYSQVVAADGEAGVDYHMIVCRCQIAF